MKKRSASERSASGPLAGSPPARRRFFDRATKTASGPLAVQPASRRRYAGCATCLDDPENLAAAAFDEIHVTGHCLAYVVAF